MRNRILSVVMVLSMITVLFAALPTSASVAYSGTVKTTDSSGVSKTEYIQGDPVYVDIHVLAFGVPSNQQIYVSLARTNDGHVVSSFYAYTNDPAVGWYNSSKATPPVRTLSTSHSISGDVQSYYVIVTLPNNGDLEVARSEIAVRAVGITLTPMRYNPYWPGETVGVTLVVTPTQSAMLFYVQLVNATGAQTGINFTSQSAVTGYWSKSFKIPSNMPDGMYALNVRAQLDSSIWYSRHFNVQAFALFAWAQRSIYLPGQTAQISYFVMDYSTMSPVTSGVNITYSVKYLNITGNWTWVNSTAPLPLTKTQWNYTLPVNGTARTDIALYSDVFITLKATNARGIRSVNQSVLLQLGTLGGSASVSSGIVCPGSAEVVTVNADVSSESLAGAIVSVTVMRNGTEGISAYGAPNLVTNSTGSASYMFKVADSAAEGNYIVNATISEAGYTIVRQSQFRVQSSGSLVAAFDQAYYYGGQTATVTFAATLNSKPSALGVVVYTFNLGATTISVGSTTTGSASVLVPGNVSGMLSAWASTQINGNTYYATASTNVCFAQMSLTAATSAYRPGDIVTFDWTIVTGIASANLAYEIRDSNSMLVANGTPVFSKSGSFQLTVPQASSLLSKSYTATLRMTTPQGAYASASATVGLVSNDELTVWVGKSPYTSGEFAPGDKVTIHYDLSSYTQAPRNSMMLHVFVSYDPISLDVIVTSPSGSITYTIPKSAPVATLGVYVEAYDAATGQYLASGRSAFSVNNQVSGWTTSIAGMSAIDLVILVLLIVVIIMLIIVPFMKDRMARPKPPEAKPMEYTPPPPSEPGKSPPAP